ncbi:GNAT family N-acetyltransferase [Microlunatus elymi]|uniref:GNAT family N-acetyltransferase n=1 Tax=Microlunatus elymi TaxID=2596828 RepID=UPI00143E030A|nr:GNAT family N-acetyltransferase [Microlunatus elymi]
MREIADLEELVELSGDDLLCRWAAQGLDGRSRGWATDDGAGIAIATPALATKDRIAVHGSLAGAASLLPLVMAEVGDSFRPFGERRLIRGLSDMVELDDARGLRVAGEFGWMDRADPLDDEVSDAHWLHPEDDAAIDELIAAGNPDSYAKPGDSAVERWAGIRDDHDRLIAVAALAWSAPDIGFIAGVTVHPDVRGNGLSERVCRLIAGESLRERGAVGLMVDEPNPAAVRTYRKLGFDYRELAAAELA